MLLKAQRSTLTDTSNMDRVTSGRGHDTTSVLYNFLGDGGSTRSRGFDDAHESRTLNAGMLLVQAG